MLACAVARRGCARGLSALRQQWAVPALHAVRLRAASQNKSATGFVNTPLSNSGLVQAFGQATNPQSNLSLGPKPCTWPERANSRDTPVYPRLHNGVVNIR